jgi:hypothetical protein
MLKLLMGSVIVAYSSSEEKYLSCVTNQLVILAFDTILSNVLHDIVEKIFIGIVDTLIHEMSQCLDFPDEFPANLAVFNGPKFS